MKIFTIKRFYQLLIIFFSLIILNSSCSEKNSTEPIDVNQENTFKFNVTYDDSVIKFDKTTSDLIVSDSINYSVSFDKDNQKAKNLKEGDIIVIGDLAIRKVKSKAKLGNKIYIQTSTCALTEAMKDADISWNYGVDFTPAKVIPSLKSQGYSIQEITSDSLNFSFKIGNYEITGNMKYLEKQAKLELSIEKEIAGSKLAKMTIIGTMNNFRSTGKVTIRNHELQEYNSNNKNMKGEFTVKISAAGSGDDINVDIPFTLMKGPLGIPFFTFDLKFLGILNAHIPGEGSTLLEEKFTYDAEQGFEYSGSSKKATPFSNLKHSEIKKVMENQHIGAASVAQMAWGIAVPRFEISLMGTTIAWFHTAFLLDAYYRFNPACQMINAHFYGAAGWALGALTVTLASKSYNLWDKKSEILKAGDCPK